MLADPDSVLDPPPRKQKPPLKVASPHPQGEPSEAGSERPLAALPRPSSLENVLEAACGGWSASQTASEPVGPRACCHSHCHCHTSPELPVPEPQEHCDKMRFSEVLISSLRRCFLGRVYVSCHASIFLRSSKISLLSIAPNGLELL